MKVRYFFDGHCSESNEVTESVIDLDQAPPNVRRILRKEGLDEAFKSFYRCDFGEYGHAYWWIRPVAI